MVYARLEGAQFGLESVVTDGAVKYQGLGTFL